MSCAFGVAVVLAFSVPLSAADQERLPRSGVAMRFRFHVSHRRSPARIDTP